MNPASGEQHALPDAGRTNPTGQWPGSQTGNYCYSSLRVTIID